MNTYEVTYYPANKEILNKELRIVYAISSIVKEIYFGLYHRAVFLETADENIIKNRIIGNIATLKISSGNLEFNLSIEIVKTTIPTNVRFTLTENFPIQKGIREPELIAIKKTYEILKDSFIFSNNLFLLSDNYMAKTHHYENRIFDPIECIRPLLPEAEKLDFDNLIFNKKIEVKQYKNLDYGHSNLIANTILKSQIDKPSSFWIHYRGDDFYHRYYKSNFDICSYVFRKGDLLGWCLNLNEDEINNLEDRLRQHRFNLSTCRIMKMGSTGYEDEYFCETNEEYIILRFENEV